MTKTFTYPSQTRLLWGGGLFLWPLFYGMWLLTAGLSGIALGLALLPEIALLWLWLYALTILGQRVTLTDQGLIYSRWPKTLKLSYADIFYARRKSSWPAGLTLVAKQGQIPLAKHLENFDNLYASLEERLPNLFTPGRPLPWPREAAEVHHKTFAQGSINEFKWYFEQESQVPVSSIEDICDWLKGCEYIDDHSLFQKRDHWQHPNEFEQTRRGDCEDHALWAWRKLIELDIEAEFVVGDMKGDYHAWVMFRQNGQHYIFETVYKRQAMINPVDQVQASYQPDYSVDRHFVTYRYLQQNHPRRSDVARVVNAR